MNHTLASRMWHAPTQPIDEPLWKAIVAALYDDFESFIGQKYERDQNVIIRPEDKQFTAWMWSMPAPKPLLSLDWSGVIAGSLAKDSAGTDIFIVTAEVFLFDGREHRRLIAADGSHFLRFSYTPAGPSLGEWCYLGWIKDEWKEWEDVSFEIE